METLSREVTPDKRRWLSLGATCFGLFMILLDVTVVNVAMPAIGKSFSSSIADLQWLIDAYTLTLAVLLVVGARLGDMYGRKRWFLTGLTIFTLGSFICGLSGGLSIAGLSPMTILIISRAVQGIGGAIMLPLGLSIISGTFQGKERGIAFGVYGGVSALGVAIGPVLGGLLVEHAGWQSIFYINIPFGIAALCACVWAIRESKAQGPKHKIDIPGTLSLTVSLFCLVLGLIQGPSNGWGSAYILALLGAGIVMLALFTLIEFRRKNPLVDPRLFAKRGFTGAHLVAFSLSAGLYALLFFVGLYLQNYLGLSAVDAGLRLFFMSLPIFFISPLAGMLSGKIGTKAVIVIGLVCLTGGLLLLLRIGLSDDPADWIVILPALLLTGVASGFINPPLAETAMSSVRPEQAGMASGINNVARQLGTALGIAVLGAVLSSSYTNSVNEKVTHIDIPQLSAAQNESARQGIEQALVSAGAFAGSTGFRTVPPEFAVFAAQPVFPQVREIVKTAFIDSLRNVVIVAICFAVLGLLAGLFLLARGKPGRTSDSSLMEKAIASE